MGRLGTAEDFFLFKMAAVPSKKRQRDDELSANKRSKVGDASADGSPAVETNAATDSAGPSITETDAWKIMLGAGASVEDTTSETLMADAAFKERMDALAALDVECSLEQMKVQRKFEDQKRPLYKARNEIISKQRFWGKIISEYPDFRPGLIDDQGRDILAKHLVEFHVNDFLDDFGSYEVTMIFDESVSEYFSPSKLVRMVKFKEDDEVDWSQGAVTSINWKKESAKESLRFLDFFQLNDFSGQNALEQSVVTGIGDALRSDIYRKPLPREWAIEEDDEDEDEEDDEEDEDEDEEDEEENADDATGQEEN